MAHRKYTDSQRAEATGLILTQGRPAALVARDMSISVTTVHRWVSDALTAGGIPSTDLGPQVRTAASTSRSDDLEGQMRDAIHRLGQLETRLEKLIRQAHRPSN